MLPEKYRHREELDSEVAFDHEECGDSRTRLYVKRTSKGHLYHCHNCGFRGFQRGGLLTPSETVRVLKQEPQLETTIVKDVRLPNDFTTEIPPEGLAWLYKYGITDEEIRAYGLGYSPSLQRLILPVYSEGDLVYWQGRSLNKDQKPKYINVKQGGRDVYFSRNTESDWGCLVEDILSAIKVGRVTSSIGLLGSYIPSILSRNLLEFDRVYIWLDEDKWKDSVKYARKLSVLLGKRVTPIRTELDPKEYSTEGIREILKL